MGLNIKNLEVERLAAEVAGITGSSKTEAIRQALMEKRARLRVRGGVGKNRSGLQQYLEQSVWPLIPETELGRVLSRAEEDLILGFGPEGF